MAESPTSRSLRYLRKNGYRAGVVEKWIPQTKRRVDLFGFIDIVAIGELGCLGIQATSTGNMSSRVTKSIEECGEALIDWLRAKNSFEVWGWAKRGAAGKRKLWTLRRVRVVLVAGKPVPDIIRE